MNHTEMQSYLFIISTVTDTRSERDKYSSSSSLLAISLKNDRFTCGNVLCHRVICKKMHQKMQRGEVIKGRQETDLSPQLVARTKSYKWMPKLVRAGGDPTLLSCG